MLLHQHGVGVAELAEVVGGGASDDAAADFLWLMPNLIVTKADVTGVDSNRTSLSFDMTGVNAPAA